MGGLNHELRAKGVGSSEVAMLVLGDDGKPLSPWGGAHRLWQIKTGQAIEVSEEELKEKKPWLDKGKFLEPALMDWYASRANCRVRKQPGTRQGRNFPLSIDSVDGLAWDHGNEGGTPDRCVEAKTALVWDRDNWTQDSIPQYYETQGQWHMGVWELPLCDYPVFWGEDLEVFTRAFDEQIWLGLNDLVQRFWTDHVEAGVAPPVDIHKTTTDWLAKRMKQLNADMVEADDETVKAMLQIRELKIQGKSIGDALALAENRLKETIGENKGVFIPGYPKLKITFNKSKGRSFVNHKAMLEHLVGDDVERAILIDKFTQEGEGSRRFLATSLVKNEIPGDFQGGEEG